MGRGGRVVRRAASDLATQQYYWVLFSMKSEHPYARIAITLPPEDLAAADRLAAALDRSRSWVIAEALRQFVAAQGASSEPRSRAPTTHGRRPA
jgi:hypothetical protein